MREIGGADRGLDAHRIAVVEHHGLVAMVVRVDVAHIEIQREQRRGGQHGREPRPPVDRLSVDESAVNATPNDHGEARRLLETYVESWPS